MATQYSQYYQEHKEKIKARTKKYYRENKEEISKKQKQRYRDNAESLKEKARKYQQENKESRNIYLRKYIKEKRATDEAFHIVFSLRHRMRQAIKAQSGEKALKSMELLGCTPKEACNHLESLWTEGMTWDNYGANGWHIDHIKPCDAFDLTNPEEQKECFHYTNLQPLWAKDNLKKWKNYNKGE